MDWREPDEQRDDEKSRVGGGRCDKAEICISTALDSAELLKMVWRIHKSGGQNWKKDWCTPR